MNNYLVVLDSIVLKEDRYDRRKYDEIAGGSASIVLAAAASMFIPIVAILGYRDFY